MGTDNWINAVKSNVSDLGRYGDKLSHDVVDAYASIDSVAQAALAKSKWGDATGLRIKNEIEDIVRDCKMSGSVLYNMINDVSVFDIGGIAQELEKVLDDLEG